MGHKELRIMGHDPGSRNYGYSITHIKLVRGRFKVQVLETGVCPCPISDMKSNDSALGDRLKTYLRWVKKMQRKYKVDYHVGERFMTRGGSSMGTTIEVVSAMLGVLAFSLKNFVAIPAVQWKGPVIKCIDLKRLYKNKDWYLGEPHELDASLMTVYRAGMLNGIKNPYVGFNFKDICTQIEKVSCSIKTIENIRKYNAKH